MIDRDFSGEHSGFTPTDKEDEKNELEVERGRLEVEWNDVQSRIRELLSTRGKTEEQIRDGQWQVETLLRQADEIHMRQTELNSEMLHDDR